MIAEPAMNTRYWACETNEQDEPCEPVCGVLESYRQGELSFVFYRPNTKYKLVFVVTKEDLFDNEKDAWEHYAKLCSEQCQRCQLQATEWHIKSLQALIAAIGK